MKKKREIFDPQSDLPTALREISSALRAAVMFNSSRKDADDDKEEKYVVKRIAGVVWCGVVWCGVVWCGVV